MVIGASGNVAYGEDVYRLVKLGKIMFLGLLNDEQKKAFTAMAVKVVMADGEIVPEEETLLDIRLAEMGVDNRPVPEQIYGDANTDIFDTYQSKSIVLMELFVLALCDKRLPWQEVDVLITQIGQKFEFSDEQIKNIHDWAQRQAPLSLEAWKIVCEGSEDTNPEENILKFPSR